MPSSTLKYQSYHKSNSSAVVMSKRFPKENWFLTKKLLSTLIIFLLLNAKYQTQIIERPRFQRYPHTAKAFSSSEHIYKHVKHHRKLISLGVKVDKPKTTKERKFGRFLGLKASWHNFFNYIPQFVFKDPAGCVSWLHPHTRHRANTFSNQRAKISSMLWNSHGGSVLQNLLDARGLVWCMVAVCVSLSSFLHVPSRHLAQVCHRFGR